MWCRELTFPTVRRLAAEIGRSPVTILTPFGRVIDIHAEVIRREWSSLQTIANAAPHLRPQRMAEHVSALRCFDPGLVRLPAPVEAAIAGAEPDGDRRSAPSLTPSALEWCARSYEREPN